MTVDEAKVFVAGELARIERQNADKELRPWMRDACQRLASGGVWSNSASHLTVAT
jgi:hypothetical protein